MKIRSQWPMDSGHQNTSKIVIRYKMITYMSANLRSPNRVRTFSVASRFWSYSNSNHDYITLKGLQVVKLVLKKGKGAPPNSPTCSTAILSWWIGVSFVVDRFVSLFDFEVLIDSEWPKSTEVIIKSNRLLKPVASRCTQGGRWRQLVLCRGFAICLCPCADLGNICADLGNICADLHM